MRDFVRSTNCEPCVSREGARSWSIPAADAGEKKFKDGQAARLRRLQATTRPIEPPIPHRTSDDGSGTELIEAPNPSRDRNPG